MLALTAPPLSAAMGYYNRKLTLDAGVFRKSNLALTRALRDGKQLTRAELTRALARAGVSAPTGQHVAHLLMQAELDGVVGAHSAILRDARPGYAAGFFLVVGPHGG
jgi:hypothetical protein